MARIRAVLAIAVAGVAAQPPQLWERLTPQLPADGWPAATSFRRMVAASGAVVTYGVDPVSGLNATFSYDPTTNALAEYQLAPGQTPDIVHFGGYVIAFGSSGSGNADTFQILSMSGNPPAWQTVTLKGTTGQAPERAGARAVVFGNTLFRFGGADLSNPSAVHADIWALDLADLIAKGLNGATGTPIGWVLALADGAVPGLYPRRDMALDVIGRSLILFGGWNGQFGSAGMQHYADTWLVHPTSAFSTAAGSSIAVSNVVQVTTTGFGGQSITPRGGMAHGVVDTHLIVIGGFNNQAQTMTDMWALNIPAGEWFPLAAPNPAPQPAPNTLAAGCGLGRHFYFIFKSADNAGDVQLWRWSIVPGQYQPPSGGSGSSDHGIAVAHSWGIALGCIIGAAQLIVFVYVARKEGWLELGTLPSLSLGSGIGGAKRSAYAPSVSSSGPGAYAAPVEEAPYTAA